MLKINHDLEYFNNTITTPSYINNKEIYLPKIKYNLTANNSTQLLLTYRELLRILLSIKKTIFDADIAINNNIETQLAILREEYPITQEKYATYCSTLLSLIYKDKFNFTDEQIQLIYNNLQNKIIFTTFSQNIINNVSGFINSKTERYNYLINLFNLFTNSNFATLNNTQNYIHDNYLDIVETYITSLKNGNYI